MYTTLSWVRIGFTYVKVTFDHPANLHPYTFERMYYDSEISRRIPYATPGSGQV